MIFPDFASPLSRELLFFFFVFWVLKSVYLIFSVLWNARENNFAVFFCLMML